MDELPRVLWAYRMTSHRPIGISPFALTYGMEAIILTEIGMPMLQTNMPEQLNTKSIIKDLDTGDELRETAAIRVASYHRQLGNLYKRRLKPRMFQPGELVLRKVFENIADPVARKLQANWEGPYIVVRASESRSYALDKLDGTLVPRMWNAIDELKSQLFSVHFSD